MRNELDVLNRNIVVPGCEFSRVALRFDVVDEATLLSAGACLQEMENCGDWWWGDYLFAYAEWRISIDGLQGETADEKEKARRHYVRNHPSVLNGRAQAETQVERYKVASFYNCGSRLPQLSNEHHREAMEGSGGDLAIAQDWLERARKHGWSKQELRAQIRSAKRAAVVTASSGEVRITQQELFAFNRWSRAVTNRVNDMEREEVVALRRELEPAAKLIARLDARISGPSGQL